MSEANRPAEPERPFVAGMYDYYLGGTANSAVDRAAVERIRAVLPEIGESAWANRGFLQRVVKKMAGEWGIRQFIDIGAGLPTQRHTHEVVAENTPDGRVVYVDSDPRVVSRGEQLLVDTPNATVVLADLREPASILEHPEVQKMIDFNRPVGLLFVAVVQFLLDDDEAYGLIDQYVAAVPAGSYLALTGVTSDNQSQRIIDTIRSVYATTPTPAKPRTKAQVARFFAGLEIMEAYPGAPNDVVHVGQWGAEDPEAADDDGSRWFYAAVGRKS